jgi:hypothetical protein
MQNNNDVANRWQEHNGVITFSVTSQGYRGKEWIKYFKTKNVLIGEDTKQLLLSTSFEPKKGKTYQIEIIKGGVFFFRHRVTSRVFGEAKKRKLVWPNPEIGCLVRDMFTDEEIKCMDISCIATMHKPIIHRNSPYIFCVVSYDGSPWLKTYYAGSNRYWREDTGFAFVTLK